MIRFFLVATMSVALFSGPLLAQNQTYAMTLGARQIGTLVLEGTGRNARLLSTLDNTPLGVADGTFEAVTRVQGEDVTYVSRNRGNKVRDISVIRKAQTVISVSVVPEQDRTEMTNAAKVPKGVISLAEGFSVLAKGTGCPEPITMYDGRRVVRMSTTTQQRSGDTVTCDMSYRVIMGPGHLSPFRFKSFGMQATYVSGALARINMRAGGFTVNLTRKM